MVVSMRARRLCAVGTVLVTCLGLTGCGGSDSDGANAGSNDTTSTTAADGASTTTSDGGTSPTKASGGSTGTISADDVDLGKSPPAIGDRYNGGHRELIYFADLSSEPKVIASEVDGQTYSLSPDGNHAAIAHPGDAVRKARLELVVTDTGKAQSFDIDANDIKIGDWSPDSTAVYVSGSGTSTQIQGVYRVDGTSQVLAAEYSSDASSFKEFGPPRLAWVHGSAGTSLLDDCVAFYCAVSRGYSTALVTSKGVPVTLASSRSKGTTTGFGRFDPDTHALVPIAGLEFDSKQRISANSCGRFARITVDSGGDTRHVLYDSDTDKVVDLTGNLSGCPVISHGAKLAAFGTVDAGPVVVDLTSGVSTSIGREGKPVAWSKDDGLVILDAYSKGSFAVAPDGSGGKEAGTSLASSCPIGDTGVLVSETDASDTSQHPLVAYDIAADSAKSLGKGALTDGCHVSDDGTWVLSADTVVDLAAGKAGVIRIADKSSSSSSTPSIRILRWRSSSEVAAVPD